MWAPPISDDDESAARTQAVGSSVGRGWLACCHGLRAKSGQDQGKIWDMDPDHIDQQTVVEELKLVRKVGVHRLRERLGDVPALAIIASELYGSGGAPEIEHLLRDAWHQLGTGDHGQALGILFGLERGHRGGNPAGLRSKAASRMGYHSVDTFRKKPEGAAIANLADQVISLRIQRTLLDRAGSEDRVAKIVAEIEALTTLESAELARRLTATFGLGDRRREP